MLLGSANRIGREAPAYQDARRRALVDFLRGYVGSQYRFHRSYEESLETAKAWLAQQRGYWEAAAKQDQSALAELRGRIAELEGGKSWLDEQRARWEQAAAQKARELDELNARCVELGRSKDWLEEQRRAWEQAARESEQRNEELRAWIGQLEQAKAALLEQLAREQGVGETLRREVERLRARTERVRRSWLYRALARLRLLEELDGT